MYTFLNFIFCLFIFGCAGSFLLHGLSLAAASRGYSLVVVKGLLLWHMVSRGHRLQQLNCKGLAALWHVRSSQTRDGMHVPYIDRKILNHWTTPEVPTFTFFFLNRVIIHFRGNSSLALSVSSFKFCLAYTVRPI